MSFYDMLRDLRIERQWTQKEVAEMLNVTDSTISSYENGNTDPGIDMIIKIAELFEVSYDYLFDIAGTPNKKYTITLPHNMKERDIYAIHKFAEYLKNENNNRK